MSQVDDSDSVASVFQSIASGGKNTDEPRCSESSGDCPHFRIGKTQNTVSESGESPSVEMVNLRTKVTQDKVNIRKITKYKSSFQVDCLCVTRSRHQYLLSVAISINQLHCHWSPSGKPVIRRVTQALGWFASNREKEFSLFFGWFQIYLFQNRLLLVDSRFICWPRPSFFRAFLQGGVRAC